MDSEDAASPDAPTRFAYDPAVLVSGEGAVAALADELAALDRERALVVTGETVGSTPAVMDPVRDGLGDRLADEFAETTPEKRLATAIDGAEAAAACDADALVAVGGGSSLDVAKAVATVAASERSVDELARAFERDGTLPVPDEPLPILAVPTTFAGAEQSAGAGLTATPTGGRVERRVDGGLRGAALHPAAVVYDPSLYATTPRRVLAGSAMNGFDKGIETLYSRRATPVTDATAARGLALFREGLLGFRAEHETGLPAAVEGAMLVQYGISRAEHTTLGPIHAVGQALSATGDVHQGVAHAVVAPHVLAAVFDAVDGRRELLAAALGGEGGSAADEPGRSPSAGSGSTGSHALAPGRTAGAADDPAALVVDRVAAVRDALGVPTRLRDLDGIERDDLDAVADAVADHRFLANGPPGFDPDAATVAGVLDAAW